MEGKFDINDNLIVKKKQNFVRVGEICELYALSSHFIFFLSRKLTMMQNSSLKTW